jgi:hypothetical protein
MSDLRGFDAEKVEPSGDFEPIPAGKYLAVVTESGMKDNKAGNGRYLQLTFEIIEGPFKGRLQWARLNLEHPNQTAVKIARSQLSALCRAAGVLTPNDSADLHNLPVILHVKCKKRADTGEITNEVAGFSKKETAAGQPQQAVNAAPPWRRG